MPNIVKNLSRFADVVTCSNLVFCGIGQDVPNLMRVAVPHTVRHADRRCVLPRAGRKVCDYDSLVRLETSLKRLALNRSFKLESI
jgi:hypothetical protein